MLHCLKNQYTNLMFKMNISTTAIWTQKEDSNQWEPYTILRVQQKCSQTRKGRYTLIVWEKQRWAPVVLSCAVQYITAKKRATTTQDETVVGVHDCMSCCVIWVSRQWECIWSAAMWLWRFRAAVIWLSTRKEGRQWSTLGVSWTGVGEWNGGGEDNVISPWRNNGSKQEAPHQKC